VRRQAAGARIEGECVRAGGGRALRSAAVPVCECHNMQVIFVPGMQAGLAGGGRNGAAIRPAAVLQLAAGPGQLAAHRSAASSHTSRVTLQGTAPALHLHLPCTCLAPAHTLHRCTASAFHLPRRLASTPLQSPHLYRAHPRSFLVCAPLGPLCYCSTRHSLPPGLVRTSIASITQRHNISVPPLRLGAARGPVHLD
jgi:hypothetical protein